MWFNQAMERVSGWYKRWTQVMILGIALLMTTALNVDSIAIARSLSRDATVQDEPGPAVVVADDLRVPPAQPTGGAERLGDGLFGSEPRGERLRPRQRPLAVGEQPRGEPGRAGQRTLEPLHLHHVDADTHDHDGPPVTRP